MSAQLDEEFRDFMHGRWPAMVRLAYALTGDQGHAEDVAPAAFARAYASWPKVRRTGNPEAYVRRIVINENRNRFRRPRASERLTDAPESARADTASADTPSQYGARCRGGAGGPRRGARAAAPRHGAAGGQLQRDRTATRPALPARADRVGYRQRPALADRRGPAGGRRGGPRRADLPGLRPGPGI